MRLAPVAAVALGLGALLVACDDDDGGPTDAEAAAATCGVLVEWTNDVAATVNATEQEMLDGDDLRGLMLAALDDVQARTEALGDEVEALDLPEGEGGQQLADELRHGQVAALEDIEGFRAEVEAIPDPDTESRNYRKAQLVVELEKPRSLVKPDVQNDLGDADLEAAIADEPSCRHVTRSQ